MVQEPTPSEQRSVGSRPHLYDATTLRTLATVERLDLLELAHGECPEPRWTEEVREEVLQAAEDGDLASDRVLRCAWLGDPVCPEVRQLAEIYRLQVALGDGREPPSGNAGEAQTIFFAESMGGVVVTDDNAAYMFAASRVELGISRVADTVHVLTALASAGHISCEEAAEICGRIHDSGRHLRRTHPQRPRPDYFRLR